MFLPMLRMVARPSASPSAVAGHAAKHVVPVRGRYHRHLVDGEVLIEHVERRRRTAATGDGDGSARLVCKSFATGIECAIECRENAAAGVRVVDRRAKDKAVGLFGGSDQLVDHVVVKGAATAKLATLAATDAIANRLGAQLKHLGIDALDVELLGDLGECAGRVAVCLGAAIDQKNLHHKLPLLSVTSAEDYRTSGQMAWGTMPAPRAHGRHAHQVRAGYGPEDVGVRGLVRADCKGSGRVALDGEL